MRRCLLGRDQNHGKKKNPGKKNSNFKGLVKAIYVEILEEQKEKQCG